MILDEFEDFEDRLERVAKELEGRIGKSHMENSEEEDMHEEEGTDEEEDMNEEGEEEIFPCKYCSFVTDDEDRLDEHIVTHNEVFEDEEENCVVPQNKSSSMSDEQPTIAEGVIGTCRKKIYICPFCDYQSTQKYDMDKHINDHTEKMKIHTYACSECPYTTTKKIVMSQHLLAHCDNSYVRTYKCSECIYSTKRKQDLAKHLTCHNKKTTPHIYQCTRCAYFSRSAGDFKRHMLCHDETFQETFNCTECGYTSNRLQALHKHAVLHCDRTIKGLFKCTKCDYASFEGNPFAKHLLSDCQFRKDCVGVVENGNNQCSDEENVEMIESSKKRKLTDVYHGNDEMICHDYAYKVTPFSCTECGGAFKQLNTLHKHAVLHRDRTIKGSFKCKKCDYASFERSHFAEHILSNCQSRKDCVGEEEESGIQCRKEENVGSESQEENIIE